MKKLVFVLIGSLMIVFGCSKAPTQPNNPPTTPTIVSSADTVKSGETVSLSASATDPDNDTLTYTWSCSKGSFNTNQGMSVVWTSPEVSATEQDTVSVEVNDGNGGTAINNKLITVKNEPPSTPGKLNTDYSWYFPNNYPYFLDTVKITGVIPNDPENDQMYYRLNLGNGTITDWLGPVNGGDTIHYKYTYLNPSQDSGCYYFLNIQVKDIHNATTSWSDSTKIAIGHYGSFYDSHYHVDSDNPYSKYVYMWKNGVFSKIHIWVTTKDAKGSVNAYLKDPNGNNVRYANDTYDTTWYGVSTTTEGNWQIRVEKTLYSDYVDVYVDWVNWPPSLTTKLANKNADRMRVEGDIIKFKK